MYEFVIICVCCKLLNIPLCGHWCVIQVLHDSHRIYASIGECCGVCICAIFAKLPLFL